MPIYEYLCQDCGTGFEKLVRASDPSEPACPSCGKQEAERQLSTFAAHAGGSSKPVQYQQMGGGCPAGMCGNPNLCGREN